MVSSKGDLYCSVLAGKDIVASNLQSNRWYHLALTYDHDLQQQEVYLDGSKISSGLGPRHHEWRYLTHSQVGTGCVTSDTLDCPYRGHIGWYGFNGIVDDFRVWSGVLSPDDVKLLATGGRVPTTNLCTSMKPQQASMLSNKVQHNVRVIKCTRPVEGPIVQQMKLSLQTKAHVAIE